MSLGRIIFGRVWSAVQRKARSTESTGGKIVANFKLLRLYGFYVGVTYCTGALVQHWVVEWGTSEGISMYPTMSEKTPFTLTSKLHARAKDMSTGDLIHFMSPIFRDAMNGKRLIGMPGDYIVLDPHQAPSVGGAPVPGITDWRSQTEIEKGIELKEREEPMMIEVPEGHIYAVGDNLSWSRDSRFFGPVPMALVNGKQIAYVNGSFTHGWNWAVGEQMRKIPKEEEEEYLQGWKLRRMEREKVAGKKTDMSTVDTVD